MGDTTYIPLVRCPLCRLPVDGPSQAGADAKLNCPKCRWTFPRSMGGPLVTARDFAPEPKAEKIRVAMPRFVFGTLSFSLVFVVILSAIPNQSLVPLAALLFGLPTAILLPRLNQRESGEPRPRSSLALFLLLWDPAITMLTFVTVASLIGLERAFDWRSGGLALLVFTGVSLLSLWVAWRPRSQRLNWFYVGVKALMAGAAGVAFGTALWENGGARLFLILMGWQLLCAEAVASHQLLESGFATYAFLKRLLKASFVLALASMAVLSLVEMAQPGSVLRLNRLPLAVVREVMFGGSLSSTEENAIRAMCRERFTSEGHERSLIRPRKVPGRSLVIARMQSWSEGESSRGMRGIRFMRFQRDPSGFWRGEDGSGFMWYLVAGL